jgi:hypothetical protein
MLVKLNKEIMEKSRKSNAAQNKTDPTRPSTAIGQAKGIVSPFRTSGLN